MAQDNSFKGSKEDLEIFLAEALEFLANTEENLVELEKTPSDTQLVQEIFRAMHTIKGGAATLGFESCVQVTHTMESILDQVRSGERDVTRDLINVLFMTLDWLKAWAESVSTGSTPPSNQEVLEEARRFHATGDTQKQQEQEETGKGTSETGLNVELADVPSYILKVEFSSDAPLLSVRCFQVLTLLDEVCDVLGSDPSLDDIENDKASNVLVVYLGKECNKDDVLKVVNSIQDLKKVSFQEYSENMSDKSPGEMKKVPQPSAQSPGAKDNEGLKQMADAAGQQQSAAGTGSVRRTQLGRTVRVDVALLDFLLNMVGELVIDRTRLSQIASRLSRTRENASIGNEIAALASHLQRTSQELQEGIMRARLLPLKNIFMKFPRMIRDLSDKCGKKVDLVVEGEDTELDRTVLEAVDDPLIHILRNAVDHGIEPPSERVAKGKPETGRVSLKAWHEENQVLIRVEDDGAGIDLDKVKKSAVKKGLFTEEQLARLSEREILEIIFMPGFSTTEKPTEVSGRGVGLDVVRSNLERINGQVEIKTWPSKGTWVTLRLPLTLAIMRALLVESSGLIYAIPTFSVEEVVALKPQDKRSIHGKPAMVVRDKVFPLFSLSEVLWPGLDHKDSSDTFALLTRAGDEPVALGVHDLLGEEEIVVKEMGRILSRLKGIAGATILAQGDPAVILDVNRLL